MDEALPQPGQTLNPEPSRSCPQRCPFLPKPPQTQPGHSGAARRLLRAAPWRPPRAERPSGSGPGSPRPRSPHGSGGCGSRLSPPDPARGNAEAVFNCTFVSVWLQKHSGPPGAQIGSALGEVTAALPGRAGTAFPTRRGSSSGVPQLGTGEAPKWASTAISGLRSCLSSPPCRVRG